MNISTDLPSIHIAKPNALYPPFIIKEGNLKIYDLNQE